MEIKLYNMSNIVTTEIQVAPELLEEYKIQIFMMNQIALCSIVGTFGMAANVINICVFVKQGLRTSSNISFVAMAMSDAIRILMIQWLNFCSSPGAQGLDTPLYFADMIYLTAGWPVGCANRITMFITAYVTAEKCLCIAAPLKIRRIVTPVRACVILVTVDVVNVLVLVPEYATVYYDWKFVPPRNKTLLGLAFRSDRGAVQCFSFTVHSVLMTFALVAVVSLTSVLIVQLHRTSRWRQENTSGVDLHHTISRRGRKTTKLVILVAAVMVTCYAPAVALSLVTAVLPDFGVGGRLASWFNCVWSFVFIVSTVQASVNIFIYYTMSTKYRYCFKDLFWRGSSN